MKLLTIISIISILLVPSLLFSQTVVQDRLTIGQTDDDVDSEIFGVYDLRDRKSYFQVTNNRNNPETRCLHIQIFQQDKGCVELDFEDRLTHNDTIVYDLENLVRNDGSPVPINLDENSYGYISVSDISCTGTSDVGSLLGNFRIVDDSGYEYRMNMISNEANQVILDFFDQAGTPPPARGNIIIPFNTVDGATHSDIFGFVTEDDRRPNGDASGFTDDLIYNEERGVSFNVFQIDENEDRISCDRKTIGCGPDVVFNYGINNDYPASRSSNLLCEGAGLLPNQQHGYISLENLSFISSITDDTDNSTDFAFICVYGLNNGNGTGSMDQCLFNCIYGIDEDGNCNTAP